MDVAKAFARRNTHRKRLVARLKSRRKYPPPVRGGTGKRRPR